MQCLPQQRASVRGRCQAARCPWCHPGAPLSPASRPPWWPRLSSAPAQWPGPPAAPTASHEASRAHRLRHQGQHALLRRLGHIAALHLQEASPGSHAIRLHALQAHRRRLEAPHRRLQLLLLRRLTRRELPAVGGLCEEAPTCRLHPGVVVVELLSRLKPERLDSDDCKAKSYLEACKVDSRIRLCLHHPLLRKASRAALRSRPKSCTTSHLLPHSSGGLLPRCLAPPLMLRALLHRAGCFSTQFASSSKPGATIKSSSSYLPQGFRCASRAAWRWRPKAPPCPSHWHRPRALQRQHLSHIELQGLRRGRGSPWSPQPPRGAWQRAPP